MRTILAVLLATSAPCMAAEISVRTERPVPLVVIDGVIDAATYDTFLAKTKGLDKALVRLRSRGGRINPAMAIGRAIRQRQWATEVFQLCESACALMWMSGIERHLRGGSRLGFHQPREEDGSVSITGVATEVAYLRELGYGDATIGFAVQAAPTNMKWITSTADARQAGISVTPNYLTVQMPAPTTHTVEPNAAVKRNAAASKAVSETPTHGAIGAPVAPWSIKAQ
jgi:membrane-bound ClpP family serine protease